MRIVNAIGWYFLLGVAHVYEFCGKVLDWLSSKMPRISNREAEMRLKIVTLEGQVRRYQDALNVVEAKYDLAMSELIQLKDKQWRYPK